MNFKRNIVAVFALISLLFANAVSAHNNPQDTSHTIQEEIELVFALDDSGSLGQENFQLQQEGFIDALNSLGAQGFDDYISAISIIYFGSQSRIELNRGTDFDEILDALSVQYSRGGTDMTGAFQDAAQIFGGVADPNANNHKMHKVLILSTDGQPTSTTQASAQAQNLQQSGVKIFSIKVGPGSGASFLNTFSDNSPVPTPIDFSDFSNDVTELVINTLSQVVGVPAVINFTQSGTGLAVDLSCDGVATNYDSFSYKFEFLDNGGNVVNTQTVTPASGPALASYSYSGGEGVYHARCTVIAISNGEQVESEPARITFAVAFNHTDTDSDGLPDSWEDNGLMNASQTSVILDLPAMGANSLCKDVFVEVDWLVIERTLIDESSRPNKAAFKKVIKAFAEAPVSNPAGGVCSGINLHIDAGSDLMLAFDVAKNKVVSTVGDYVSGGNKIVDTNKRIADELFLENEHIFKGKSEAEWIRQHDLHFSQNRNGVFRYGLMVPYRRGENSGRAYGAPGAGFYSAGESHNVKDNLLRFTDNQIASTFMHELGHSLGLGHGGIDSRGRADDENFKPNYLSIMNYHYQQRWLGTAAAPWDNVRMDFSRWSTVDLDETDLNEVVGIGIVAPSGDAIANDLLNDKLSLRYSCGQSSKIKFSDVQLNGRVDWNCDGDTVDNGITEDINLNRATGAVLPNPPEFTVLDGSPQSDWELLSFRGYEGAGVGIVTAFESFNDRTKTIPDETFQEPPELAYNVTLEAVKNIGVVAGQASIFEFFVQNLGVLADDYQLSASIEDDLFGVTLQNPTVTLDSQALTSSQVNFLIPANAAVGETYIIHLEATSLINDAASDSVDVYLEVRQPLAMPIPDTALLACINEEIGVQPTSVPSPVQLQSISILDCSSRGIVSLEGIQNLTALERVVLSNNDIVDLSPLSGLTNLQWLLASGNNISDLSPLTTLTALTSVDLSRNAIVDISPLSSLSNVVSLNLSSNQIEDLSPLAGLTTLKYLFLEYNNISDIGPLEGLTGLIRLNLSVNVIVDITPLENVTSLTHLNLWNNDVYDITVLQNLVSLEELSLNQNNVIDISPLFGLQSLRELDILLNCVTDISGLNAAVVVEGYDSQRHVDDCLPDTTNPNIKPASIAPIIDMLLSGD